MHIETVDILETLVIIIATAFILNIGDSSAKLASLALIPQEQTMSITESSNKIKEPKSYKKPVSNHPIHGRCWKKAIKDKLQNLENYQIREYDKLLPD